MSHRLPENLDTGNISITPLTRSRFSIISYLTNNGSNRNRRPKVKAHKKGSDVEAALPLGESNGPGDNLKALSDKKSASTSSTSSGIEHEHKECPLCLEEKPISSYPELSLPCLHASCEACLEQYLKIEICESRIDITCPECPERLHPTDIQKILKSEKHMSKYEEFTLRRVLINDPDTRWCPAPDCGYAVIARGCAGCPMLRCERPECGTLFCYHCKQEWHANQTCDAARLERIPLIGLSFSDSSRYTVDEYKPCPRCKTVINKIDDGSCNHMTCSMCSAQFCWLCLKEASDLHYLSPSGCTFWGKKPWSKKKKILWQLGTLIGAPVGIALIAGISVPLIVFGFPIVVGRKLFRKLKSINKHKRNLVVVSGSFAALLLSPVISALAIAIGVPILLAYVYGVVPISLCRSGTCGVKSENGSFTLDFSKSETKSGKANKSGGLAAVASSSSTDSATGSYHGLSASSIQVDRAGLHQALDQYVTETGSNVVRIIDHLPSSTKQRLSILADVNESSHKVERKGSFDSDQVFTYADSRSLNGPDNRSMKSSLQDNRSYVSSVVDNVSMKALAGSISAAHRDSQPIPNPICKASADEEHGSPLSRRSEFFPVQDNAEYLEASRGHRTQKAPSAEDVSQDESVSYGPGDTSSVHIISDKNNVVCERCPDSYMKQPNGGGDGESATDAPRGTLDTSDDPASVEKSLTKVDCHCIETNTSV